MPKKDLSGGFTKAAQNQKFVRNRDVKLKQSEVMKEAKIQKIMCEGVCSRCRDKVQWRFKYDKYKPLKNVGTCQNCKNKCVTKAYHSYCDACGKSKGVCPSCCKSYSESAEESHREIEQPPVFPTSATTVAGMDNMDIVSNDDNDSDSAIDSDDDESEMGTNEEAGGPKNVTSDLKNVTSNLEENPSESRAAGWIEKTELPDDIYKFASLKYSKARVVGADEDKELVMKFSGNFNS